MTRTATRTAQQRPLPGCKAPAPPAPVCPWCDGGSFFGLEDCEPVESCYSCGGSGEGAWVEPCEFRLPAARSQPHRRVEFNPNTLRLRLTVRREVTDYDVREIRNDEGRGWELTKVDGGEVRNVEITREGVHCDCPGFTYLGTARANQLAYDLGGEVYPGHGCKHADALVALYRGGWLDLGK